MQLGPEVPQGRVLEAELSGGLGSEQVECREERQRWVQVVTPEIQPSPTRPPAGARRLKLQTAARRGERINH